MASPGAQLLAASSLRFIKAPAPSRIEVSPDSWRTARAIGDLLSAPNQGAGLIIDYGDDHHFGDTFRVSLLSWLAL